VLGKVCLYGRIEGRFLGQIDDELDECGRKCILAALAGIDKAKHVN